MFNLFIYISILVILYSFTRSIIKKDKNVYKNGVFITRAERAKNKSKKLDYLSLAIASLILLGVVAYCISNKITITI